MLEVRKSLISTLAQPLNKCSAITVSTPVVLSLEQRFSAVLML